MAAGSGYVSTTVLLIFKIMMKLYLIDPDKFYYFCSNNIKIEKKIVRSIRLIQFIKWFWAAL